MMDHHKATFIAKIKDFALESGDMLKLGIPPFQLWIEFGEAMAFFESQEDEFSEKEVSIIRSLDEFITNLPPEPDKH